MDVVLVVSVVVDVLVNFKYLITFQRLRDQNGLTSVVVVVIVVDVEVIDVVVLVEMVVIVVEDGVLVVVDEVVVVVVVETVVVVWQPSTSCSSLQVPEVSSNLKGS